MTTREIMRAFRARMQEEACVNLVVVYPKRKRTHYGVHASIYVKTYTDIEPIRALTNTLRGKSKWAVEFVVSGAPDGLSRFYRKLNSTCSLRDRLRALAARLAEEDYILEARPSARLSCVSLVVQVRREEDILKARTLATTLMGSYGRFIFLSVSTGSAAMEQPGWWEKWQLWWYHGL